MSRKIVRAIEQNDEVEPFSTCINFRQLCFLLNAGSHGTDRGNLHIASMSRRVDA